MFTKKDSPALPVSIGDLLDSWGQVVSDPLLSEHTLLQLERGKGIHRIGGDPIDAIITLVAASEGPGGLVEMAGASVDAQRRLWDSASTEIIALAAESNLDPLVLIDRHGLSPGGSSVGSVVRMRIEPDEIESVKAGERMRPSDSDDILTVINLAFEGHPENGNWTTADLADRMKQPWFDSDGFLVERTDRGVVEGFCWTKVHADGVGEIYLVAVHPDLKGRGTGKDLVKRGLSYLRDEANCSEMIVYSVGDNEAARGLYESLGFIIDRIDHRVAVTQN